MRRIAAMLTLIGFVFTFFSMPFMGIDLLIDAVGYLLVWNGIRSLHKRDTVFGFAPWCALALIVICALQLFFVGTFGIVISIVRFASEALLFWQLGKGFAKIAKQNSHKPEYVLGILLVVTGICTSLFSGAQLLFFPTTMVLLAKLLAWFAQAAILLTLVRFASLADDE